MPSYMYLSINREESDHREFQKILISIQEPTLFNVHIHTVHTYITIHVCISVF